MSDAQLSLLLEHAEKFTSLQTILLFGPNLQPSSVADLSDSFTTFPVLEAVHFGNVAIPNNCLSKMNGVRYLSIHARNPAPPGNSGFRLTKVQLETIGNLSSLEVLSICDYDLTDEDLLLLSPSRSLKYMTLLGSDVTNSGIEIFTSAHPDCELNIR